MSRITRRSIIPVNQVTPLTYRDGVTYIQLLTELSDYIKGVLHPSLQHTVDQIVADVEAQMDKHHDQYVDGVQEFQRIHDAFMSDVNAALIALNDAAVSDLVEDGTSKLGNTLREIFTQNTDFNEFQDTTATALTGVNTRVDGVDEVLNTRLSRQQLNRDYDVRTRLNTKTLPGGTAYDRLYNAVGNDQPVQFDEHAEYDGNIPYFWDNTVYGTGTLNLPNGDTFTPEPVSPGNRSTVTVNNVYVDGDRGTPDGDGLTPATAMDTINTAYIKVLRGLTAQQASGARWVVNMTGTLDGGHRMYDVPDFPNVLHFRGYDGCEVVQSSSENDKGLWFEPCPTSVEVTGIHFRGFRGVYGYGVYARYNGHITVTECEFTDCQYGAAAIQNMVFFFNDNIMNPSVDTGFVGQYNSTGQFNRNTMIGNGSSDRRGVHVTRNTVAHVDNNHIEGYQVAGVAVDMASRAQLNNNVFDNNAKGVTVAGSSEWGNNDNTFHRNNTSAFNHYGAGKEQRFHANGDHTGNEFRVGSTNRVHGSESWDLDGWRYIYRGFYAGRIMQQWLQWPGKYLHMRLHGHTDAPNTRLDFGAYSADAPEVFGSFGMVTLPESGYFQVDVYVYATAVEAQRTHITAVVGDSSRHEVSTSNVDMSIERDASLRAYGSGGQLTTFNMNTYALG